MIKVAMGRGFVSRADTSVQIYARVFWTDLFLPPTDVVFARYCKMDYLIHGIAVASHVSRRILTKLTHTYACCCKPVRLSLYD